MDKITSDCNDGYLNQLKVLHAQFHDKLSEYLKFVYNNFDNYTHSQIKQKMFGECGLCAANKATFDLIKKEINVELNREIF